MEPSGTVERGGQDHLDSKQIKQQQLRLLSLVESAETKLKRQQAELDRQQQLKQQQQQQHETLVSDGSKGDAPPATLDSSGRLQVAPARRLSASLGWQMKSPAFVTLNEGELERLATDGDGAELGAGQGANPNCRRSSSSGRSLRSHELSSCATGGVVSRSPPDRLQQQQQHQPLLASSNGYEHEQSGVLAPKRDSEGDKLDKNDIGASCLSQRRDYAARERFNSSSTSSSSSTTTTTSSSASIGSSNNKQCNGNSQSGADLIVAASRRAQRNSGPNEGTTNKLMLEQAGGGRNHNEIGQLSDCATRERRKSTTGWGLNVANDKIAAAAAAETNTTTTTTTAASHRRHQQATRRDEDENENEDKEEGEEEEVEHHKRRAEQTSTMAARAPRAAAAPNNFAALLQDDSRDVDWEKRRGAKNMTNRRPEEATKTTTTRKLAETPMNTSGGVLPLAPGSAAAALVVGGQDKDKIDGRQLEDDGLGWTTATTAAAEARVAHLATRRPLGLDEQAAETKLNRTCYNKLDSHYSSNNNNGQQQQDDNKRASDEFPALMLQKSVNDYGTRAGELSVGSGCASGLSGDPFILENHAANKDDYQPGQPHQLTKEQQQRQAQPGQRDDRGGPTPTNDLVRTLLQRDRRAFERPAAREIEDRYGEADSRDDHQYNQQDTQQQQWQRQRRSSRGAQTRDHQHQQHPHQIEHSDNDETRRERGTPSPPSTALTTTMNGDTTSSTVKLQRRHYSDFNAHNNNNNNNNSPHRLRDDAIEMNARRHSSVLDLDLGSLMISSSQGNNNNNNKSRHQQQHQDRRLSGNLGPACPRGSLSSLRLAAQAIESMQQQAAAAASASSSSGSGSGSSASSSSCSSATAATAATATAATTTNAAFQLPRAGQTARAALTQFNKCLDFTSNVTRKPEDNNDKPGWGQQHQQLLSQQQQQQQVRRHSTYMLPLLLLNKRAETSTESDDDDERLKPTGKQQDADKTVMTRDKNKKRRSAATRRRSDSRKTNDADSDCSLADNDDDDEDNDDDHDDDGEPSRRSSQQYGHHHNLPNSASSPSALSTPTNEIGLGRGGCGGPCCSQQAELFRLTTESALSSRQLPGCVGGGGGGEQELHYLKSPHYDECDLSQFGSLFGLGNINNNNNEAIGSSLTSRPNGNRKSSQQQTSGSTRRESAALASSKQQQQQQVILRHRAGSNPLDRVCKMRPHQVVHLVRHTQQQQPAQQQQQLNANRSSNWAGKRHSIINLLAGSASQTTSGRLNGSGSFSKRRSLASSGGLSLLNSNNNNQNCEFMNSANRQRARRLTSGGELTTSNHSTNHQSLMMMRPQASEPSVVDASPTGQYDPLIPESGFKIVVMGTSGSGKTAIIQRFLYGTFSSRHLPTVEDTYFIEFPHKKNTINISVSDTSGTYQFPAMRRLAINSGDAFILVYSVDDPQSFDNLEQLRQTILDEREQAYLDSIAVSDSSSTSSSTSALTSLAAASCGRSGSLAAVGQPSSSQPSSLASNCGQNSTTMNSNGPQQQQQQQNQERQHQQLNQLHPNLSLNSSAATVATSGAGAGHTQNQVVSPSRNWSLASLFGGHNHQTSNNNSHYYLQQQQRQQQGATAAALLQANPLQGIGQQQHHHSSIGSSLCSTGTSSCSSSADNSRRSSISAAEAALKTRRTRKPPMVIVANKHDLPKDKHLVNSDEIEALAVIDWNNGFVRASAALNWNIDEIFQQVLMQARQPPTLTEAIVSKRRKSLPPRLPHP